MLGLYVDLLERLGLVTVLVSVVIVALGFSVEGKLKLKKSSVSGVAGFFKFAQQF